MSQMSGGVLRGLSSIMTMADACNVVECLDVVAAGGGDNIFTTVIVNGGGANAITITTATSNSRTYTLPDAGGAADFVMTAGAQTLTGVKTMSGANVITHAPTGLKLQDSNASHVVTIAAGDESADRTASIPVLGGAAEFVMTVGNQTIAGNKTFSGTTTLTGLVLTDIDAGASGTVGSLDIFPTTAAKGKLAFAAADSAGDTTTTITNASQAGARTYTIPDAGASASFVMTAGAQTVTGAKTFASSALLLQETGSTDVITVAVAAQTGGGATLTIPDYATVAQTLVTAELAQTIAGVKTMTGANVITHAPTGLKVQDSNASHICTIAFGDESADRTASVPVLGGAADFVMTVANQTIAGNKTFSGTTTLGATALTADSDITWPGTTGGPDLILTTALDDALSIHDGTDDFISFDTAAAKRVVLGSANVDVEIPASAQLIVPAGSASAPSIYSPADVDTGIFFDGTNNNNIFFSAGNSTKFQISGTLVEVSGATFRTAATTPVFFRHSTIVPFTKLVASTLTTAGAETYTAAHLLGGLILRDCNGSGRTDTTSTAALLCAGVASEAVDDFFECWIINTSDAAETITLAGGTGVTLIPATITIAQNENCHLRIRFTNVTASSEAVTMYAIVGGG